MTIFCIIARDRQSHDEWVMPKTFETILESAEYADQCKKDDPRFAYRIDAIEPKLPSVPAVGTVSLATSEGDFGLDERTREFTLTELYGWFEGKNASEELKECSECGAAISNMEGHRQWHNKLLP